MNKENLATNEDVNSFIGLSNINLVILCTKILSIVIYKCTQCSNLILQLFQNDMINEYDSVPMSNTQ